MIPKSRLDEESSKRQAAEARLAELEAASKAAETKQLEDNKKFEELYKKGNTIILVTHEEDIAHFARRIIRLKDGMIESYGTVKAS